MKNLSNSKQSNPLIGEQPLLALDEKIKFYAQQNNMKLTKNSKDWPERTLSWKNRGIRKLIQIYLEKEDTDRFLLWGCAYKDKLFSERYWWKMEPIAFVAPIDWNQIEKQVNLMKDALNRVTESQLKKQDAFANPH